MKPRFLPAHSFVYAFLIPIALLLGGCSELSTLREIKADQEQRIAGLERKLREKDEALTRAQTKGEADANTLSRQLRQTQEERRKALAESSEREERLSAANQKAQKEIAALIFDRDGYKDQVEKLQGGVDQLTKDLAGRKTELDAARKETAGLKEGLKKKTDEAGALNEQLKTAAAEAAQQRDTVSKTQKDLADVQAKAKKLEENNQALQSTASDQKKLLDAAKGETERTKEAMASLDAAKKRLENGKNATAPKTAAAASGDLKAVFLLLEPSFKALPPDQAKYAAVTQDERGVVVRLSVDYLFKAKSVQLNPLMYPMLDHVAEIFKKYPKQYVDVQGHTDNQPVIELPFEDNWGLASERANKVLRYLMENGGIDPARLRSSAYASSRPLPKEEGNTTMDRRVEIVLTPNP